MMEERRKGSRRERLVSVRFPDRRRGFPRRLPAGGVTRTYHVALASLRDQATAIALLASLLLALNLADLTLTLRALEAGAVEVNPFMAALFESGWAVPAKLGLGAVAIGGLWSLRRYRQALAAMAWVALGMGLLVAYQAVLLAVIAP